MPGYHLTEIPKGEIGEVSKILEETLEVVDASKQNCKIMVLVELSDLVGAIELYLERHHPNLTIHDLQSMSEITQRAFKAGER